MSCREFSTGKFLQGRVPCGLFPAVFWLIMVEAEARCAAAVDAALEAFRSKPEDAAALPPLLTPPEKVIVVEALAQQIGEAMRRGGGRWRGWLYALHLAAPPSGKSMRLKFTQLGRALLDALKAGREPGKAYVEAASSLASF